MERRVSNGDPRSRRPSDISAMMPWAADLRETLYSGISRFIMAAPVALVGRHSLARTAAQPIRLCCHGIPRSPARSTSSRIDVPRPRSRRSYASIPELQHGSGSRFNSNQVLGALLLLGTLVTGKLV